MKDYIFIHGKNTSLSQRELSSVFHEEIIYQQQDFSVLRTERVIDQKVMDLLGGTIKICEVIDQDPVDEIIENAQTEKIVFAVSQYGGHEKLSDILQGIKNKIKKRGSNARFLNNDYSNVSSGLLNKSRLLEKGTDLVRCFYEGKERWGKTIVFQNIDSYSKRDYEKPKRDMKVGMMPPKLCQIMINLAGPRSEATIYDPFCGLGTIVMEGMLRGNSVMGSDLKGRMIDATIKNTEWLCKHFSAVSKTPLDEIFFQHDATQAFPPKKFPKDLVIVTEGYLGPPLLKFPEKPKQEEIFKILDGINSVFFAEISKIIPSGNKLAMTFPYFRSKQGPVFYPEELLRKYEKQGFEIQHELRSLLYERKNQVVGREVVIFQKV